MTTEKKSGNDIAFTIRVNRELKDAFVETANRLDRPASLLIRDFMRDYLKKNGQRDLFNG